MKKITKYTTFDKKKYGDSVNPVQVFGDVSDMSFSDGEFDAVINNQSIECYPNPFIAVSEMHRVLKKGGVLLIDMPFNHNWFGYGSTPESCSKKNKVYDYWRITPQGLELLLKDFDKVELKISGPNNWEPYCIMAKAVK